MKSPTGSGTSHSGHYLATMTVATVVVAILAWIGQNPALAFATAILGLYSLHLLSIRFILEGHRRQLAVLSDQWSLLEELTGHTSDPEEAANGAGTNGAELQAAALPAESGNSRTTAVEAPPAETPPPEVTTPFRLDVPIPRHFALGTVALVRNALDPAQVADILAEQRKRPDVRFGNLAVELGFISESQKEDLLLKQQEGLFTDAELRAARRRLKEFRDSRRAEVVEVD